MFSLFQIEKGNQSALFCKTVSLSFCSNGTWFFFASPLTFLENGEVRVDKSTLYIVTQVVKFTGKIELIETPKIISKILLFFFKRPRRTLLIKTAVSSLNPSMLSQICHEHRACDMVFIFVSFFSANIRRPAKERLLYCLTLTQVAWYVLTIIEQKMPCVYIM